MKKIKELSYYTILICGDLAPVNRNEQLFLEKSEDIFMPVRLYLNFLDPKWSYSFNEVDMVAIWQEIFQKAAMKDMSKIQQLFSDEIIKFGQLIEEVEAKFKKT